MNYFFITGTGKGLGMAIAQELLNESNNVVFGLSRYNMIKNSNYHFVKMDMSDINQVIKYNFPNINEANSINLINNAGEMGHIKPIGKIDIEKLQRTITINLNAAIVLINSFVKTYQDYALSKIIVNISSGAARYPVPSWTSYCVSKAGLDMTSLVLHEEQKNFSPEKRIKCFAIAPGVVDTNMQDEIRDVSVDDFPLVDKFVNYKKNNELWSAKFAAKPIIDLFNKNNSINNVLIDSRDIIKR